jgi:quinoprotein glucose dehydrogenase
LSQMTRQRSLPRSSGALNERIRNHMKKPLLLALCLCASPHLLAQADTGGWPVWGGDGGGTRFSGLREINKDNVGQLQVAWEYRTGDSSKQQPDMPPSSFLATPVLYNNTLYFCSGFSRAFALDAETGQERWVFDSKPRINDSGITPKCRGVALWQDTAPAAGNGEHDRPPAPCQTRVFMGTLDARLVAVDAATGEACLDFGAQGAIDLRQGMGAIVDGEMAMTSPPLVINDLVVQGAMVRDNQRADSPGGVIRAWGARSGELRWAFDPVPPGAPSPEAIGAPKGQRFHFGTPNSWGIASADPERNLIFVPFGSPGLDFIGGHRKRHGFDLAYYANSVVALDALTGAVVWHFQVVHHDLWDYDLAAQPVLIDLVKDGKTVPALVQATKMGHVFILNRETGEPLYPVEERPVPQTKIAGEYTAPTQPFPTFPAPLHPYGLQPDDAWGFTFFDRQACREKIEQADNEGIFTPPALNKYSIEYPGVAGGQNWGGLAYDANNRLLIMPQNYVVTHNTLIPREQAPFAGEGSEDDDYSPDIGTPYVVKHEVLLSPFGVPCVAPPWGTLLAVSLDTGRISWEVPLGTPQDMVPGFSWFPFFPAMGLPSAGGPIVTDTGLVFIGAAMDNYIRAFDAQTGGELWRHRLPAGGQATPMTYAGQYSGRQFVVIAAGGHAVMRTTLGDTLVAFSLAD